MSRLFVAWNVNGYSDTIHNHLIDYIADKDPDLIFLSETKKRAEDLTEKFEQLVNYNYIINAHNPYNYHGVAMLIKKDLTFEEIEIKMDIITRKDTNSDEAAKGRIICIYLNNIGCVIGTYVPNSGSNEPQKLHYRVSVWDPRLSEILNQLADQAPTIWLGDINVALTDNDVSNPKIMANYAGFTLAERANLTNFLASKKWIDIWRENHPDVDFNYTWRGNPIKANTYRAGYGMRLDNIIISADLKEYVDKVYTEDLVTTSDHVPVCLRLFC